MPSSTKARTRLEDCWICTGLEKEDNLEYYETQISVTKLNPDQFFTGYSFVTLKWHETELYNLKDKDRKQFLEDMSIVATALGKALKPDKMNYELLGNGMPHLHWHLIPRYVSDPMWGRPIWTGNRGKKRLTQDNYAKLISRIKSKIKQ